MHIIRDFIFLVLFLVFLVGWVLVWGVFHLAGGAIHLLAVLAVIFLVFHFIAGRRTV